MKKNIRIFLKYKSGEKPDELARMLKNADENDLRTLLYLALCGDESCDGGDICRELEIDVSEFDASVKYWRGAGVIATVGKAVTSKQTVQADKKTSAATEAAHRDGKVESSDELPEYSSQELAELMEKRRITSQFIDEASRIYGKIFNPHEVGIIVRMIDYIGFDEECVLMLLSHYVANGKKQSLRYIEKAALSLYDEGITDSASLQAKLKKMEKAHELEGQIQILFGMNGRTLTTKEKKFISSWVDMGFGIDVIRLAYDITVDNTHEVVPAYTNSILERWYADGLDTYEKITKALADDAAKKSAAGKGSGKFETDEFFEAALRRSYDG